MLGVFILIVGAQMSLDRDFTHTRSVEALGPFSPAVAEGLVTIAANGMEFRARVAGFDGDGDKPVGILLHGFPVTSAMWNALIDPLAQLGLRVVAFDQRGYSPGARPEGVEAYTTDKLIDDVLAVADAVGAPQFHLIGHDWGAGVGWGVVLNAPERVASWTGLSIAHPAAFSQALQDDPDQQARSGYFALFQTPWVPETLFTFNQLAVLKGLYQIMPADAVEEYVQVFSEPGGLTAALNWYRAMGVSLVDTGDLSNDVETPTLFIWGNQDGAVGRVAIDAMAQFMKGPYRNVELDAGHWLIAEKRAQVVEEVVSHLAANL